MRNIDLIVVHCSYTKPSMDIGAEEIRKWHKAPKPNGRGWSDIGYHFIIRRDGTVENGRPIERPGAHARGYNDSSIGICLVGGMAEPGGAEFNYTADQLLALDFLCRDQYERFGATRVCGHNELDDGKTCPNFNVAEWWK